LGERGRKRKVEARWVTLVEGEYHTGLEKKEKASCARGRAIAIDKQVFDLKLSGGETAKRKWI